MSVKQISITLCVLLIISFLSSTSASSKAQTLLAVSTASPILDIPTLTVTAITSQKETPESTPQVTYHDMLDLYKEVLETTKWSFQLALVIISLGGIGAAWWLQKSLQGVWDANTRAKELEAEFSIYKI